MRYPSVWDKIFSEFAPERVLCIGTTHGRTGRINDFIYFAMYDGIQAKLTHNDDVFVVMAPSEDELEEGYFSNSLECGPMVFQGDYFVIKCTDGVSLWQAAADTPPNQLMTLMRMKAMPLMRDIFVPGHCHALAGIIF